MLMKIGTLIFFCGKMGAGKSTKSKQISSERNAILISEDEWLASLYPGDISTFDEYLLHSRKLKPLIETHVVGLLRAGASVVMDFPANTKRQREWFKQLITKAESPYELHYLIASDELCLRQIAQRRIERPERAEFDTESVFNEVSKYFEAPDESEELQIQGQMRDA
jgi:predicted kinase